MDPDLAEAGAALAVAPMVPLMVTGMTFTAIGNLGGIDPILAAGVNMTGGALGFAIGGSRLALDYSGNPSRATLQHEIAAGMAIGGLALFDVATALYRVAPPFGTDALYGFSGAVTVAMALIIAGNVTLATSAENAREQAGFVSAGVPLPYVMATQGGVVLGFSGQIGPAPLRSARRLH